MSNKKKITYKDIKDYIKSLQKLKIFIEKENKNLVIHLKTSNLSNQATEQLVRLLIKDEKLKIRGINHIHKIESVGKKTERKSNDLFINNEFKLEIKGTSSKTGLITVSKNNLDCHTWIWLDFEDVVSHKNNKFVKIRIITNPKNNISPKLNETNGEYKLNFNKLEKDIINFEDYRICDLNIDTMEIIKKGSGKYNEFIGYDN